MFALDLIILGNTYVNNLLCYNNLEKEIMNTQNTTLLYLLDSYQKEVQASVIDVTSKGIVLDQTIFYSQGGGQPSDRGEIVGKNGQMQVTAVAYNNGNPLHQGAIKGTIEVGDMVTLHIDWAVRYRHMQWHTAGHILDESVKQILPPLKGVKGQHGIGKEWFIVFDGRIEADQASKIQMAIDALRANNEPIIARMVTKDEIEKEGISIPFKLPENKPLRVMQIGKRGWNADGGTQLSFTGEAWPIIISQIVSTDEGSQINYQVEEPQHQTETIESKPSLTLEEFSQQINLVVSELVKEPVINDEIRVKYLGKKGIINQTAKAILRLSIADRKQAGTLLNQTKLEIEAKFTSMSANDHSDESFFDPTVSGDRPELGHLHPVTQAIKEIQTIFESIGFTRVRYPEVDWDHYAFTSLNMPTNHPARDEWETFFIDMPEHEQLGRMVLTPHTSNGQVREMERVGEPPIRMLNIAKCYRRQQDVTHTAMFHQFEGLVIDKGITIQHLKGTLDYFARKFYGPSAKSRIRPFMFKFTEPSFEVDFSCTHCDGTGCRFCKSGWHEVGGAGMVHPNVLKAGGIDPEIFTGFAFGWGVERVFTLKPGLELDDIRPLYGNNLSLLNKF